MVPALLMHTSCTQPVPLILCKDLVSIMSIISFAANCVFMDLRQRAAKHHAHHQLCWGPIQDPRVVPALLVHTSFTQPVPLILCKDLVSIMSIISFAANCVFMDLRQRAAKHHEHHQLCWGPIQDPRVVPALLVHTSFTQPVPLILCKDLVSIMSIISFAANCVFMDLRHRAASIMSIISLAGDPSKVASCTSRAHKLNPDPLVLCTDLASIMSIISFAAECVFMELRRRAASIMSIISLAGDPSNGASGTFRAHELCLVPFVLCKDLASIISSALGNPSKGASGTSRAHELYPVPHVLCKDLASIMSNISLAGDLSKGAFGTSCAHEICPVPLVLARIWQGIMSLISFAADCVFVDWRHWAASIMSIISFAGDPSKGASGTSCAHEICPVLLVLCKDLASIMSLIRSAADCVFRHLRHRAASIMSIISFAGDPSKAASGTSRAHELCSVRLVLARIWQAS